MRVWRWKEVMLGSGSSSSSSSSSGSWFSDLICSDLVETWDWEPSKMPRLPILSPAKTSALSTVG